MRKLIAIIFGLLMMSCVKEVGSLADLKSDFYELQNRSIRMNDTLKVNFNAYQDRIDSVSLLLNGKRIQNNTVLDSLNSTLGLNQLEINVYTNEGRINGKTKLPVLSSIPETPVEFEVIKEYPHPKELFTQGFFFHNGLIYESAGQYKKSKLVTYRLGSTDFVQEKRLDGNIFAEGCALLNDKIYQLTYRERKVFVFDANSLELKQTIQMPAELREGWGLTSDGKQLIASDGSQDLYFFDENLNFKRQIQVVGNVSIYDQINELEYIGGKIFANVWQTSYLLVINPESGRVEKYYDLKELNEANGSDDVLNGIAFYDGKLLVTGKLWSKIYEINLPKN
ncbi:MAG: glutaminyl-peptide cyclotransferase [Flavobacteriia bacterium]|nr:glutaminyl-peptide cyclotransferase [Flavobacteriia bacterium]